MELQTQRGIRLPLPTVKTPKTDKVPFQAGNEDDGLSRLSHGSLIIAAAPPRQLLNKKTSA